MWWIAPIAEAADRLPVLVLATFDDGGHVWADVAPMWIDTETATATDLLLAADDSTTGNRWRVVFRHQFVAARTQLETLIGRLTPTGSALLDQAYAGAMPPHRLGSGVESEHDPRLLADDWIGAAIRILARPYAEALDAEEGTLDHEPLGSSAPELLDAQEGTVLSFRLDWRARPQRGGAFRLAADTSGPREEELHAVAEDPASGRAVEGVLSFDLQRDAVLFDVATVHGIDGPVRLVVSSDQLSEPVTVNTELGPGHIVVLTSGLPVSEQDVTSLELRIP